MNRRQVFWAHAALRTPPKFRWLWFIGRRKRIGNRVMDSSAQALGEFLNAMRPSSYSPSVKEARLNLSALISFADNPGPGCLQTEDIAIPGKNTNIVARIYRPNTLKEALPMMVYLHGGGMVLGDLNGYDNICAKLSTWGQCIVISVAYRLAPEHKFPAAPEDCITAYNWIVENALKLGGNSQLTAIGGDSAGGNLTAVVCQNLQKFGKPMPRLQILIYPGLDMRGNTESHRIMENAFILPRNRLEWFAQHYLVNEKDRLDVRASPMLADDLQNQPTTYIVSCGFDPLLDDANNYASKLRAAGVTVEHRKYRGQIHGFTFMTKLIPEGDQCLREIGTALKRTWQN